MKVFLDNNLSPKIARTLAELFRDEHEVVALKDKFKTDIKDEEWIGRLSQEDKWVVISGDRRMTKNKVEYNAFRRSRLVGFFLSPALQKAGVIKQLERILALWFNIEKQVDLVQGSAMFEMQITGTNFRQIKH